jgi:hypothetical protein
MRSLLALLVMVTALGGAYAAAPPRVHAQCSDDYLTVENVGGEIMDIVPAPEPFRSADIVMSGPKPCERMWMQVLKVDAVQCRPGDHVEAKGVVTSDPDSDAWQINPEKNEYMLLGQDYTCVKPEREP